MGGLIQATTGGLNLAPPADWSRLSTHSLSLSLFLLLRLHPPLIGLKKKRAGGVSLDLRLQTEKISDHPTMQIEGVCVSE